MILIGSPKPGGSSKELLGSPEEANAREERKGHVVNEANGYSFITTFI